MTINLKKGQKVDLTKGASGISELIVGLGWDPVKKSGGGLLSGLFGGGGGQDIDCDASVLMLQEGDRLHEAVYFGQLKSKCKSVVHTGDNLTGDGDGDDEQIFVSLNKIPSSIHKLVFVVNIYQAVQRKQDFGMIQNAFIRIVNKNNNVELCRYDLTENYSKQTALIAGEVYRYQGEWKFAAIGQGTTDPSLKELASRYS
ncbi:TerD family protein [Heliorestis acidaminivorans]|uniref:TerD family protein n=1 Tax=Heliorestis acidaminivorans TaxID=553427 RepID=A0A6I0F5M1_9FIRM|nr:TerD family protein [Heliorestis acidaminivorans]KAB2952599.1 TerD family protein [Heliorestis acidaminivorans]